MNNPVLFGKCNNLPRRDTNEFLKANASKLTWKIVEDRSLDIGSADGGVTMNILRKYLPENYGKLVGCDIGGEMVRYANKNYEDKRTYFVEHDIRSDVPKDMKEEFDHVFSFYTLHWIRNQRRCMNNIFNILVDGGECLVMLVAQTSIYDVYRLLAQQHLWAPYLSNVEEFISPYQDSLEPEKELRVIMEEVGFRNVEVTCKHKTYFYTDVNLLKGTIASICPFKIPNEIMDKYLDDFVDTATKHQVMEDITDDNGKSIGINYTYTLLWAYGLKQ